MQNLSKRTAIKFALVLLVGLQASLAWAAQVVGSVVNLSGPLMAHKADGSVKVLAVKSEVEPGDTLVAEKNTYAQIRFIDKHEITLRPGTTFKIEAFAYDAARPEGDSASFSLVKGGLRSITGLLGKRNRDKFELKTPAATIGIRGTTFVAQFIPLPPGGMAAPAGPTGPAMAPGLYVHVIEGLIVLNNPAGSQHFSAGQFGFTPSIQQPPIILPANPGLKFAPPPVFGNVTPVDGAAGEVAAKVAEIDCEVR